MAIKNKKKLANYISNWIKEKAEEAGATSLVVGISGGVDSALVAALCVRTGMKTVGVLMPCQSSPSSLTRGAEVVKKFGLENVHVNLTEAFYSIRDQVELSLKHTKSNATEGALRSCLRAPTLDYVGKVMQGIIVGTGNRDEDEVTRYFQKRGDGCVDISPIAKLHKSEVYELSAYLGVPKSVLEAKPSADLWGPDSGQEDEKELGMTYADIERGINAADRHYNLEYGRNMRNNVNSQYLLGTAFHNNASPVDILLMSKLAAMELASRHKTKLPVCNPASEEGLLD